MTSCGCCVIKYVNDVPHILLVRPFERSDVWGIPKGHLNDGESIIDCAIRETREETGVDVVILEQLSPVQTSYRKETKTVVSFMAKLANQNCVPYVADKENVDVRFMPLNDTSKIHVYQKPLIRELINKVSELPKSLFI